MYRDNFFLFPLVHQMEHTVAYEECYSSDEMGYWIYPAVSGIVEKVCFYFNGNAGNNSTRICTLEMLRQLIPEYQIIQLEYAGYGISAHLPLELKTIIEHCHKTVNEYLENHPFIVEYGFWGESLGGFIQGLVYEKLDQPKKPDWIVQINGVCDLEEVIAHALPPMIHLLVIPFLKKYATLYDIYRKSCPRLLVFQSDRDMIIPPNQGLRLSLETKAKYWALKGGHNLVLQNSENNQKIRNILFIFL